MMLDRIGKGPERGIYAEVHQIVKRKATDNRNPAKAKRKKAKRKARNT